jgi:hypothetical protein
MNTHRKRNYRPKVKINAGGTDNVPPALCPPPAYASACVPAHVERTGRAGMNENGWMGCARPLMENRPVLKWEAA